MSISADDVYTSIFSSITGIDVSKEPWVTKLWSIAKPYVDSGQIAEDDPILFDIILSDKNSPQEYKDRFAAITALKNKPGATFVPTVAQYITMENKYKATLDSVGLGDIASNEQISKYIENEVSLDELSGRIEKAFVAIDNADEMTKSVLAERFPGLTRQDIAKGLLLGKESAYEISKKVAGAQIAAEARRAGITPSLSEQEIAAQGLSQTEVRKAFASVAQQQQGIAQAAQTYGYNQPGLQAELQQEQLGIQPSERLKALRSQARAEFSGQSGIQTGSLSKKKQV